MTKQVQKYQEYIIDHKDNVKKAFIEYGMEILGIMKNESLSTKLGMNTNVHDNSKFAIAEFSGYKKKFYPDSDDIGDETIHTEFDKAWLHHMNTNKHHPEYWVMRDKAGDHPIDMDRVYIAEMILDGI